MLISDILLAYAGKIEMLKWCFHPGEEETARPLDSVEAFDRAFGGGKD